MRLDHLLSKEQLAQAIVLQNTGYRVQSHISGERPGVASSLVEHWLFGLGVNPLRFSTSATRVRKRCRRGRNGGKGEGR